MRTAGHANVHKIACTSRGSGTQWCYIPDTTVPVGSPVYLFVGDGYSYEQLGIYGRLRKMAKVKWDRGAFCACDIYHLALWAVLHDPSITWLCGLCCMTQRRVSGMFASIHSRGSLRNLQCGPFSMFTKLSGMWHSMPLPEVRGKTNPAPRTDCRVSLADSAIWVLACVCCKLLDVADCAIECFYVVDAADCGLVAGG